jgi:hypothetical protein
MHYNIEIDTERKIVIAKIYGIWKPETALEYSVEYKKAVQPLLKAPWAKLHNLTNWKSSYPEIIEILGEHMRWTHENGAIFTAYAIDNPVTTNQLKQMVELSESNEAVKIFKTFSEADRFLRENGF